MTFLHWPLVIVGGFVVLAIVQVTLVVVWAALGPFSSCDHFQKRKEQRQGTVERGYGRSTEKNGGVDEREEVTEGSPRGVGGGSGIGAGEGARGLRVADGEGRAPHGDVDRGRGQARAGEGSAAIRHLQGIKRFPYQMKGNAGDEVVAQDRGLAILEAARNLEEMDEPLTYANLIDMTGLAKKVVWATVNRLSHAGEWPYRIVKIWGGGREDKERITPDEVEANYREVRSQVVGPDRCYRVNGQIDHPAFVAPPRSFANFTPPEPAAVAIKELVEADRTRRARWRKLAREVRQGRPVVGETVRPLIGVVREQSGKWGAQACLKGGTVSWAATTREKRPRESATRRCTPSGASGPSSISRGPDGRHDHRPDGSHRGGDRMAVGALKDYLMEGGFDCLRGTEPEARLWAAIEALENYMGGKWTCLGLEKVWPGITSSGSMCTIWIFRSSARRSIIASRGDACYLSGSSSRKTSGFGSCLGPRRSPWPADLGKTESPAKKTRKGPAIKKSLGPSLRSGNPGTGSVEVVHHGIVLLDDLAGSLEVVAVGLEPSFRLKSSVQAGQLLAEVARSLRRLLARASRLPGIRA